MHICLSWYVTINPSILQTNQKKIKHVVSSLIKYGKVLCKNIFFTKKIWILIIRWGYSTSEVQVKVNTASVFPSAAFEKNRWGCWFGRVAACWVPWWCASDSWLLTRASVPGCLSSSPSAPAQNWSYRLRGRKSSTWAVQCFKIQNLYINLH